MRTTDFNNLVDRKLEQIKKVLINKTAEYNLDVDRLSVFKRAGELQSKRADEALLGMLTKHIISIYDMVKTGDYYPTEKWDEKCIDAINYLLLLLALEQDINNERCQEGTGDIQ